MSKIQASQYVSSKLNTLKMAYRSLNTFVAQVFVQKLVVLAAWAFEQTKQTFALNIFLLSHLRLPMGQLGRRSASQCAIPLSPQWLLLRTLGIRTLVRHWPRLCA